MSAQVYKALPESTTHQAQRGADGCWELSAESYAPCGDDFHVTWLSQCLARDLQWHGEGQHGNKGIVGYL
jgi:hypothetical protein